MPARNAGDFIRQSIDSVLAQTYPDFELIIIDDKSTDKTREIVNSYADTRIKIVDGQGAGISSAFNTGLEHAQGEYFCRCDADDLFPPNRLAIQVDWLDKHPDYVAVCGSYTSIDKKGRHIIQYHRDTFSRCIDEKFREGHVITHFGTFLCLTKTLREIGGCRDFFITAEDIDLQLRLSEKGKIYFIADNFYRYRLHNLSITHTQASSRKRFYEKVAKKCHTQRLASGCDDVELGQVRDDVLDSEDSENSHAHILNLLLGESWYWHKKKNKKMALKVLTRLLLMSPFQFRVWKNFILIVLKPC